MIKQSSAVLAIFLGSTDARMKMRAPRSINLFATGANGDEDLGQDIIMKGDKYHYQQMGQVEISESANAPVNTAPVRARDDEKKEEPKKEEKKDEKKSEKKGEKKDAKGEKKDEKKADAKDEKKDDKKEDAKADAKADAKEDKKDAKDDEKKEEEKEEKKEQKPGEATWEDHNDCKENEWEAADGNCAFEAEAVKIASHDHRRYPGMDSSLVQVEYPQQDFAQGPNQPAHGWWNDPQENKVDRIGPTHYDKFVRYQYKESMPSTREGSGSNYGRPESQPMPASLIERPYDYVAKAARPTGTKMSLAQWSEHDFNGNPERVHIIDPVSYQNSANTPSYLGNRRTAFFAQGDDQPSGTNQGQNQLTNTPKNLDWQEGQYRNKFTPPSNVAIPKGVYKNVIEQGRKAKVQADARKAADKVVEEAQPIGDQVQAKPVVKAKPQAPIPTEKKYEQKGNKFEKKKNENEKEVSAEKVEEKGDEEVPKAAESEIAKVLDKVEKQIDKTEIKEAKKELKKAVKEAKDEVAKETKEEVKEGKEAPEEVASGSESGSESDGEEEEVQVKNKVRKYDTCINGSCQTPQWPGEILPGSEPVLRIPSEPVDDGYTPTLNAVFDNRFNVQLNEQLNQRETARKFDTCINGSCQTPQWPGEILPGSEPVMRIPSEPIDDGYTPTLNAVFDNRWN